MTRYHLMLMLALRRMSGNWRLLSSVGLGTIVAGAILSATIIYADTIRDVGLKFAIEQLDPVDLDVQVSRSSQTGDLTNYQRSESYVGGAVTNALAPVAASVVRQGSSATFFPVPTGSVPNLEDNQRLRGNIMFRSDFDAFVRTRDGEIPTVMPPASEGPLIAAVGANTAQTVGISVGDTFDLFPFWDEQASPLPVLIVGIIEAHDPEDRYWAGDRHAVDAPIRTWDTVLFHVPESTFFGVLAHRFPEVSVDYDSIFQVRLESLSARNATRIADGLTGLQAEISQTEKRTRATTELTSVLHTFDDKLFFTRIPLFILLLQIGGIATYYLVMVSTMVAERQTTEIVTLRSRGATTGQLLTQYGIEGAILAALAIVVGPPLAASVIALLGLTPAFSDLSGGGFLEVSLSGQAYALAGLGALIAFAAVVLPAWLATRRTIVEFKRALARPQPTPGFLRYYMDVALVLFAAIIFWRLSQQETLITENLFGDTHADPFLLATPAVFMVTVGVVFLRLFPLLLRIVAWLVEQTGSVAAMFSLRSLVRNPRHYSRLVLLLMFATGVGMFGATFSATLDQSYKERAYYLTGSDIRAADMQAMPEGSPDTFRHHVQAIEAEVGMPVMRTGGTIEMLGRFERVELIGVDPEFFEEVTFWRNDFSAIMLHEIVNTLSANEPPIREGISIPESAQEAGIWLKAPNIRGPISAALILRDANGVLGEFNFGKLTPDDEVVSEWRFFSTSLSKQTGIHGQFLDRDPLTSPLTLEAIRLTTGSRIAGSSGTVLLGSLYVSEEHTQCKMPAEQNAQDVSRKSTTATACEISANNTSRDESFLVADFTDSRFEPINGFLKTMANDFLGETTDAPPGASVAALLEWQSAERSSQIHGIREQYDEKPINIFLSKKTATLLALEPGDPVSLLAASRIHSAVFSGTLNLFPTFKQNESSSGVALVNANRLIQSAQAAQANVGTGYNEAWFRTSDPETTLESLERFEPLTQISAEKELLVQQQDPLVAAGWSGILSISFGAVLALSGIGFVVYSYLSAQQRGLEFAILQTLGFSRLQVFTAVLVEQIFVIVTGMALGTLVGLQIGRLMMGFIGTDESGSEVIPPFLLAVSWPQVFVVWGILGVVFLLTITGVVLLYFRLAVHRALRIGDT